MGSKNRVFVVVNPASGGGLGGRRWPTVAKELKKEIGPFEFKETSGVGQARGLSAEAAKAGFSTIVAYGGDGTIHEVVNGFQDSNFSPKPTLGILCVGTGGDLIKSLQIPRKWIDQVKILSGGKSRRIDLGQVDYTGTGGKKERRLFVNITDAGLGAEVVRRVGRSRGLFGRKLAYLASTLRSYLDWPPREIAITTEHSNDHDDWPRKSFVVAIANGRFFGGGMPIAPRADPADGFFDVVVIGDMNGFLTTLSIPLLYARQLVRLPNVRTDRARKVTLESMERVNLDIDGEPIGSLPATFEILPGALEILVP